MAANELDSMADSSGVLAPIAPSGNHSPANRLVLHLGVLDVPYSSSEQAEKIPQAKKGKANKPIKPKSSAATKTTGDVAEILEEEYGIMQSFADHHLPQIAKQLEDSISGALENLMMGAPASGNPFKKAESGITSMMKNFISSGEVERVGIEGTPTQAALNGVNHRLKHPYAKSNPRRPSFIDTTLYMTHMISWID